MKEQDILNFIEVLGTGLYSAEELDKIRLNGFPDSNL